LLRTAGVPVYPEQCEGPALTTTYSTIGGTHARAQSSCFIVYEFPRLVPFSPAKSAANLKREIENVLDLQATKTAAAKRLKPPISNRYTKMIRNPSIPLKIKLDLLF
jgi:hypothetical protein